MKSLINVYENVFKKNRKVENIDLYTYSDTFMNYEYDDKHGSIKPSDITDIISMKGNDITVKAPSMLIEPKSGSESLRGKNLQLTPASSAMYEVDGLPIKTSLKIWQGSVDPSILGDNTAVDSMVFHDIKKCDGLNIISLVTTFSSKNLTVTNNTFNSQELKIRKELKSAKFNFRNNIFNGEVLYLSLHPTFVEKLIFSNKPISWDKLDIEIPSKYEHTIKADVDQALEEGKLTTQKLIDFKSYIKSLKYKDINDAIKINPNIINDIQSQFADMPNLSMIVVESNKFTFFLYKDSSNDKVYKYYKKAYKLTGQKSSISGWNTGIVIKSNNKNLKYALA